MTTKSKTAIFRLGIAIILPLIISPQAWSKTPATAAHVHGEAELMLAIEGLQIELQFISPAANILGFEHAPSTAAQTTQIQHAATMLSQANMLFEFTGSSCHTLSQSVEMPFLETSTKSTGHDHASHDKTHNHPEHAEVVASYVFTCDSNAPNSLSTTILELFPAIESLNVQWLTETKQGAQELTATQTQLEWR